MTIRTCHACGQQAPEGIYIDHLISCPYRDLSLRSGHGEIFPRRPLPPGVVPEQPFERMKPRPIMGWEWKGLKKSNGQDPDKTYTVRINEDGTFFVGPES